ncbi:Fe2OG dioxygenase domain-containing protein [Caenorhabditis elegans]|uniref:Fe2OG dioxygenase domain-containing protein n=1 Tax=Caenorhabditis elegans TaxID=6239 RepID=B1V8J4_CAEEL|nr:Fe2OG dioxygenase domain-containing protein [Caenorhabditis elegans]CAQ35068.1 Fe2OG dioxygenase domain-containing protein [Caenorhabditis elegans]|eukprot:NP_001123049.1 Proline HYdroxylase [Caenorhabditis elegans]
MYPIYIFFIYSTYIFNFLTPFTDETLEFNDKIWDKCGKELRGDSSRDGRLVCYRLHKHLLIRKVEILSSEPFILQYHNQVHRRLAKRAVQEAEALRLEQLKISGFTTTPEKSQVRAANGTWLIHTGRPSFARIFEGLQANINSLDLSTAEPWQILSYNADGYYAPHYDYLNPATNVQLVEGRGNRIATVLVILQIAKKGGTTVFPRLNLNIRPKAGDVIVWLNTLSTGESNSQTLHAACPIHEGTKIGATLWVHEKIFSQNTKSTGLSRQNSLARTGGKTIT